MITCSMFKMQFKQTYAYLEVVMKQTFINLIYLCIFFLKNYFDQIVNFHIYPVQKMQKLKSIIGQSNIRKNTDTAGCLEDEFCSQFCETFLLAALALIMMASLSRLALLLWVRYMDKAVQFSKIKKYGQVTKMKALLFLVLSSNKLDASCQRCAPKTNYIASWED